MKKNWFPKLIVGSCCLWSGVAAAQSNWDQTTTWNSTTATQPNGYPVSSSHLYGYSQPPQAAPSDGQFVGGSNTPRYPLPTQLPAATVPPAGMSTSTPVSGSFTATTQGAQQSFPVSYRQDLVIPQQPAVQAAPEIAPPYQPSGQQSAVQQYVVPSNVPAVQAGQVHPQPLNYGPGVQPQYQSTAGCDIGAGPAGCDSNCNTAGGCGDSGKDCGLGSRFGKFFCGGDANWVVGVNALIFARDYEDDKGLSYNSTPGQYLFSTDADFQTFAGLETVISRRNCSGSGWEARYWGLYPNSTSTMIDNMPGTALTGLQNLDFAPAMANVLQVYDAADRHRITRDNTINSLELNLLRNGGSFTGFRCRNAYYELLGGFRWFQFDENFTYSAINSAAPWPSQLDYGINVRNSLLGFQLGGRTEWCLTDKLRLATGLRAGVFNNRISHNSRIADQVGNEATIMSGPFAGAMYDFESTKNDIAFLGELDTGLIYQISCRTRLNFGYRVFGVNGLALAPNQFPYNFTDANDIQRIDSNGGLLLHGAYAGAQFCF